MLVLSQTYRMAPSVTVANAATLEQAEYRVRTEVGLANTGHRHTSEFPTEQGTGSANSPAAIWCFLSSSRFDCYEKTPYQAGYTDPSQGKTVNVGIIGIVDDCHGQTNQFTSDGSAHTVASLLIQAQHNTQLWNNLLAVSGGVLELSKTSCHVLQWQSAANGAPILAPYTSSHMPALSVQDTVTTMTHNLHVLSL
jgi:hypothetical protein